MTPAKRWALRGLAAIAMAGSAVLAYQGLNQTALPGCGPTSGCDAVLGSEWASWLGVPVGVPAAVLYALMLGAALNIGPNRPASQQRLAWGILWIGAVAALGAAIWFIAVQIVIVQALCKYCLVVHVSGIALAALALTSVPRRVADDGMAGETARESTHSEDAPAKSSSIFESLPETGEAGPPLFSRAHATALTLVGLLPVVALVAGQWLQPPADTMQFVDGGADSNQGQTSEGAVTLLNGMVRLRPEQLPTLGPERAEDAEVWGVLLFDYTCRHCRAAHPKLLEAIDRYDGKFGLVMLPLPLDPDCNPIVPKPMEGHETACELASLALGVWRVDPSQFEAFDKWVMSTETPPSPEEAQAHAETMVDATALRQALLDEDNWISEHFQNNARLYRAGGLQRVPTMIVGTQKLVGPPQSAQAIFDALEQIAGLAPPAGANDADADNTDADGAADDADPSDAPTP